MAPRYAPGWPGITPRWTSSAKEGLGTALSSTSRVWFTLSHGVLNEVYYPRVDQACTRDFGFLVAGDDGYFVEEKRTTTHTQASLEPGVPAYKVTNTCPNGRFTLRKEIICDPNYDVVLQRVTFTQAAPGELRLYALLAPHLVNGGANNTAWVGDYKGDPMIFAEGDGTTLALAAINPFRSRSVGFVGVSDGWQQISRDGRIVEPYDRAENGNVALTAELDVQGESTTILVALAFGRTWSEAAYRARASLLRGYDIAHTRYVAAWRDWQSGLRALDSMDARGGRDLYRIGTAVLRCHESPTFAGGFIASLSIPWGADKSDDDLGGYHLVWPRDLVQTAGGFLAAGATPEAIRILEYLRATQEADGHWPQNMWLDGTPYWSGVQLDETAFPILLVDMLARANALTSETHALCWPMVDRARRFILHNGPVTGQDRWEEDGGYSPFTLAVTIAALLVAAEMADTYASRADGDAIRATADAWNDSIEDWIYARDTPLAKELGIDGYYVRIAPANTGEAPPWTGHVQIKNVSDGWRPAADVVSVDALALVRFGLRRADDPRILNTIAAIDHLLRVTLPSGPCWRRYNSDGYGEHSDGSSFDGVGIGRAWPLLAGERAHYELAAGRPEAALALLRTVSTLTSAGGFLPEQVWDADDMPARELFRGKPSGSAMPLVWAHAEDIKLRRSLADGAVFDMPPLARARYADRR